MRGSAEEIARFGVGNLVVDELIETDLNDLDWSGSRTHIDHVRKALARVPSGDVEYLVIRSPEGAPIAKGGIDYAANKDAGTLWQLATHGALQGLGLGTRLIEVAEGRIRARGHRFAYLSVEDGNTTARRLYERLGYSEVGRERASWEAEDGQGNLYTHEADLAVLRKEIS